MKFLEKIFGKSEETPPSEIIPEEKHKRTPADPTEVEKVIEKREKISSEVLGGGANISFIIKLKDDGSAIFKPQEGECEDLRKESKSGTYYKRERAAYLVSRFLNLNLVPSTVIREIDGRIGSTQEFIPNATDFYRTKHNFINDFLKKSSLDGRYENYIKAENSFLEHFSEQFLVLAIFDYIIWNSDRHGGNFLMKDQVIYAIDHGLVFAADKLSLLYYPNMFTNKTVPAPLRAAFHDFLSWESGKNILRDLLLELLPGKEVDAFFARLEFMGRIVAENEVMPAFPDKSSEYEFYPKPVKNKS